MVVRAVPQGPMGLRLRDVSGRWLQARACAAGSRTAVSNRWLTRRSSNVKEWVGASFFRTGECKEPEAVVKGRERR